MSTSLDIFSMNSLVAASVACTLSVFDALGAVCLRSRCVACCPPCEDTAPGAAFVVPMIALNASWPHHGLVAPLATRDVKVRRQFKTHLWGSGGAKPYLASNAVEILLHSLVERGRPPPNSYCLDHCPTSHNLWWSANSASPATFWVLEGTCVKCWC